MPNPNDISLSEFISSAERNMRSSLLPPGYFAKQTFLQVSDVFTATYGRKVWDALNNQTRFWNILRKVQWGPTTGWRVRSDRGPGTQTGTTVRAARSLPVTEVGALPTIDSSAFQQVDSLPRIVATSLGVSLRGQIVSGLEGGMGDNLAVEQEAAARDHIKELNSELLLRSHTIVTTAGATNVGETLDIYGMMRPGDTFGGSTLGDTAVTFSGQDGDGDTVFTGGGSLTDGEILYVKSRAGFTSISDIIEEDGRTVAGVALTADGPDVYNISTRVANDWNTGANIQDNDGTGRNLNLTLMDTAIRNVRINGADPDVIVLGYDQFDRLSSLLQAQQRYLDWGEFVVKVGDESTLPGSHAGFQVATYRGIPVIVDPDMPASFVAADTFLGGEIMVLDSRYLEVAIAAPTQYIDNRDFFQANAFVLRGLFYTIGELRALRLDTHSKITDLNT